MVWPFWVAPFVELSYGKTTICCWTDLAVENLPLQPYAALAAINQSVFGCRWSVRVVALILLCGTACALPAHRSYAQSATTALAQSLTLPSSSAPLLPFTWPSRFSDHRDPGPPPLYAAIEDFLRRARGDAQSWSVAHASAWWFPATTSAYRRYTGASPAGDSAAGEEKRNSLAERRPDLPDGATGEDNVIRFVHYRLPWLVTPESAIHALPALSVRSGDTVSFEVMGGAIGGRSGAYGQLVLRF